MNTKRAMNMHLQDARTLLKESFSANRETRKRILEEVKEIIEFVEREET